MRRRLLQVVVPMTCVLAMSIAIPLAYYVAGSSSRGLFVARSNDADAFVDAAERPLRTSDARSLVAFAQRYDELFDTHAIVVDVDRRVIASSRSGVDLTGIPMRQALDRALNGLPPAEPAPIWPWTRADRAIARPVINDGRVLGAVLLVVSTEPTRQRVTRDLALLVIGVLGGLGALIAGVVQPLSRWVLRPVADLDDATQRIAGGALDTQVPASGRAPELRQLAGSFNAMARSLDAARKREHEFVADASHQLRSPLTSARINVERIADESPVAHAALLDLRRLGDVVDRLARLSYLDDAATRRHPADAVDLAERIRPRLEAWQSVYTAEGLRLQVGPMSPGRVPADLQTDDILDVLLDNAAKYGKPPVVVSVLVDADDVILQVLDHGRSLGDQDLARLGQRFWRSPNHQATAGTGLGLAIVKAEADRAGGRLAAHHDADGRLIVEVRLPKA